jgi:hypothetical protein
VRSSSGEALYTSRFGGQVFAMFMACPFAIFWLWLPVKQGCCPLVIFSSPL